MPDSVRQRDPGQHFAHDRYFDRRTVVTAQADTIRWILDLLGEDVRILHPRREPDTHDQGGGDIDCVVARLDPLWPLRLPKPWRLCQRVHYDVGGSWYWVLEYQGEFLAIDTLDDPSGRGRLGFPTSAALDEPGLVAIPAVRAAYLTAKRLVKDMDAPEQWRHIGELATQDASAYVERLDPIFGHRCAERLARSVLDGEVPDASLRRVSRRRLWLRRVRRDSGGLRLAIARASRIIERVKYQTGLCVLVVGPDGVGKSTLADSLATSLAPLFRTIVRLHWRPNVLPHSAALIGDGEHDSPQPHRKSQHGPLLSLCLLLYHWADFHLGHLLRVLPVRVRSGLVLWERGWWDIAIDPRRYRLRVPRQLVRFLGTTIRQPDLVLILEASPDVISVRKAELSREELVRQTAAWRDVLPRNLPRVHLDSDRDLAELSGTAFEAILGYLHERTTARLGSGWTKIRGVRPGIALVPRSPRSAVVGGLSVEHPVTLSNLVTQHGVRSLGLLGVLRFARRASAGPPDAVREVAAPFIERGGTVAVAPSSHSDRHVLSILSRSGDPQIVVKVATDEPGSRALAHEALVLEHMEDSLPAPLAVPRIIARGEHSLVLEALPWRLRARPWLLPPEVAYGLGSLFASTSHMTAEGIRGFRHRQCTPWTLLNAGDRWYLVDWEMADDQGIPFFDIFHYVVLSHAMLHRPSRRQILDGLVGRGWVGAAVRAYADGAKIAMAGTDDALNAYLAEVASTSVQAHGSERDIGKVLRGLTLGRRG